MAANEDSNHSEDAVQPRLMDVQNEDSNQNSSDWTDYDTTAENSTFNSRSASRMNLFTQSVTERSELWKPYCEETQARKVLTTADYKKKEASGETTDGAGPSSQSQYVNVLDSTPNITGLNLEQAVASGLQSYYSRFPQSLTQAYLGYSADALIASLQASVCAICAASFQLGCDLALHIRFDHSESEGPSRADPASSVE